MELNTDELLNQGKNLFRAGEFSRAYSLYTKIIKEQPDNYQAMVSLGRINLFNNLLKESENWLKKAMEINPEEKEPKMLLAEVYHRQDNFKEVTPLLNAIGRSNEAKLSASLEGTTPYQIEDDFKETTVKFVMTDPLPVVKCRINNSEEALFLIDTGAPELNIDIDFARRIGVKPLGRETAVFAGGMKGFFEFGRADQVELGNLKIKNVPVHIHPLQGLSRMLNGLPIQGILGTVFLYHFIFTFDYPKGELILQRKSEETEKMIQEKIQSGEYIKVPFWMAGDHFILAWGTVNQSKPLLFFVDTGMAGGGFSCSETTRLEANINLSDSPQGTGIGGGGPIKLSRAVLDEITLGEAKEKNIVGLFPPMPPSSDYRLGFRMGGIISHAFFRPYRLIIDFTNMNLLLKRSG